MKTLAARFAAQIDELGLAGRHVLVACSGGLDSVVLAHLFWRGAPSHGIALTIAHFDHAMRSGSGNDALWLKGLCTAWELPIVAARAEVELSSEANARAARYDFLENAARLTGAHAIATAHHADDQAETVLFRLLRGTGVDGLAGIPRRRGRILRPLLDFSRAELESYAREHGISCREDPSNRSNQFARNRIRHDVLPVLEQNWPGAGRALRQVARDATRSRQAWDAVLEGVEASVVIAQNAWAIELARPLLLKYHPGIRARLWRRLLARAGYVSSRAGTAAIETFISAGESGTGIHVKGGLLVEREFDQIRLRFSMPNVQPDEPVWIADSSAGMGQARIAGACYQICWSIGRADNAAESVAVDPAAVRFPLAIRAWRPGDRIHLPYGSKKLKKLFAERRLDRQARTSVPLLVEGSDNVLWIAGLLRSSAARAAPDEPALCITVVDAQFD